MVSREEWKTLIGMAPREFVTQAHTYRSLSTKIRRISSGHSIMAIFFILDLAGRTKTLKATPASVPDSVIAMGCGLVAEELTEAAKCLVHLMDEARTRGTQK